MDSWKNKSFGEKEIRVEKCEGNVSILTFLAFVYEQQAKYIYRVVVINWL